MKTFVSNFFGGSVSQLFNDGNQFEDISSLIKLDDWRFFSDVKAKDNDLKTWSYWVAKENTYERPISRVCLSD